MSDNYLSDPLVCSFNHEGRGDKRLRVAPLFERLGGKESMPCCDKCGFEMDSVEAITTYTTPRFCPKCREEMKKCQNHNGSAASEPANMSGTNSPTPSIDKHSDSNSAAKTGSSPKESDKVRICGHNGCTAVVSRYHSTDQWGRRLLECDACHWGTFENMHEANWTGPGGKYDQHHGAPIEPEPQMISGWARVPNSPQWQRAGVLVGHTPDGWWGVKARESNEYFCPTGIQSTAYYFPTWMALKCAAWDSLGACRCGEPVVHNGLCASCGIEGVKSNVGKMMRLQGAFRPDNA